MSTPNISEHWQKVSEARLLLGDQERMHYMCSIADRAGARAGVISVMDTTSAARAMARGTARPAIEAEIVAEKARNEAARTEIERAESARLRSHLFSPQFTDPGKSSNQKK